MGKRHLVAALVAALIGVVAPQRSWARVVELIVDQRTLFVGGANWGNAGPYQMLRGAAHLLADPSDQDDARIVDFTDAPRNPAKREEFSTQFLILEPVDIQRSNHKIFYVDAHGSNFEELLKATTVAQVSETGAGNAMTKGNVVLGVEHVRLSGGDHVRIRLSDRFGTEPPVASVGNFALKESGAALVSSMDHSVTFGGVGPAATVIQTMGDPVNSARAQSYCEKTRLCADPTHGLNDNGYYVGHDEPPLLFYSAEPGSGNSNLYYVTLPTEPTKSAGAGGVNSFRLYTAFFFGMALCDSQSAPEFTHKECAADSDANIFDDSDPTKPHYAGHQPGGAYMELQFYPPAASSQNPLSCDPDKWCAALNIDSYSADQTGSTTIFNNAVCRSEVSDEPVNFAWVTRSGSPTASRSFCQILCMPRFVRRRHDAAQ